MVVFKVAAFATDCFGELFVLLAHLGLVALVWTDDWAVGTWDQGKRGSRPLVVALVINIRWL